MSHHPDQPASGAAPRERTAQDVLWSRVERRRERIRADIRRDRAGGHPVPTWAPTALLALLIAGWLWLIVTR
jgi:hypothetical protein